MKPIKYICSALALCYSVIVNSSDQIPNPDTEISFEERVRFEDNIFFLNQDINSFCYKLDEIIDAIEGNFSYKDSFKLEDLKESHKYISNSYASLRDKLIERKCDFFEYEINRAHNMVIENGEKIERIEGLLQEKAQRAATVSEETTEQASEVTENLTTAITTEEQKPQSEPEKFDRSATLADFLPIFEQIKEMT